MKSFQPYITKKEIAGSPFDFLVGDLTGMDWYDLFYSTDESEDFQFVKERIIKPGDTIFECGGHHGFTAVMLSKFVGEHGKVITFEPNLFNFELIRKNILINGMKNLFAVNRVVGSKRGPSVISGCSNATVLFENGAGGNDAPGIKVDTAILDDYKALNPTVLKLDVEGFEVEALKGAFEILKRAPGLAIEIHTRRLKEYNASVAELLSLIGLERYRCWVQWKGGEQPVLFDGSREITQKKVHLFAIPRKAAAGSAGPPVSVNTFEEIRGLARGRDDGRQPAEKREAFPCRSAEILHHNIMLTAVGGMPDYAAGALEKMLDFYPHYRPAVKELEALYARCTKAGKDRVFNILERSFTASPTDPGIADAYHTAVSELGLQKRAVPIFAGACASHGADRKIRYLMIDVLLKAGEYQKALDAVEQSLVLFSTVEGLLDAALDIRKRLGPLEIDRLSAKKATLSFCLIVKDEEADLPRCLGSIKPVADEIIIVDTGSKDRTGDVAGIFGAKVFDFDWRDDFAAAKNFAIAKATGNWIFSIDADEVLSPLDHAELIKLIGTPRAELIAFSVTTRNYLKGMDTVGWRPNDGGYPEEEAGFGWFPSTKVRLFPNDPRISFSYPVHEMVEPSLERSGIVVQKTTIPIHHYGKLNPAGTRAKGERYYKIGMSKLDRLEGNALAIRELAIQAQTLERYKDAVRLWERLAILQPDRADAFLNMGAAFFELGDYAKGRQHAAKAMEIDPGVKEGYFNFAICLLHQGHADGARQVLRELKKSAPEYLAARFLYFAACCCEDAISEAETEFRKLLRTDVGPGLAAACRTLAARLEKAGRKTYAAAVLSVSKRFTTG